MLSQYSVPVASESDSQTDMTPAVTGGVVAVVFINIITIAAVTVVMLRKRSGHYFPGSQKK